jgi:hypothetical protein
VVRPLQPRPAARSARVARAARQVVPGSAPSSSGS